MLFRTVGVEELTADVNNLFAVPVHYKSFFRLNLCNLACLKIFTVRKFKETFEIFGLNYYSHTLLRLTDCKLGAVKTFVLLRNCVEVDHKTVSKLTDSNGYTACTKVVTTLNHAARLSIAEKALKLSFLGSITLLNLCTASFNRMSIVCLGRTCCTTDTVTACTTAEKNYNVTRSRTLSANICSRSSRNNCADFHTLCSIAIMVNLINNACCKTNLVTVRGITRRSSCNYLSLRKLTLDSFANRL